MKIFFIDVDDTIISHGNRDLSLEVIQKFKDIYNSGDKIYLFTARSKGNWIDDFRRQGLKFEDVIYKPVADEYVLVDDRLAFACRQLWDI